MADLQDEEQWLYGDDKEDSGTRERDSETNSSEKEPEQVVAEEAAAAEEIFNDKEQEPSVEKRIETETNGDVAEPEPTQESQEAEQNGGEKPAEEEEEDDSLSSSSDDEPTVTIGKIVKQPDIMRPPPPTHRAAPTSGLKDDDFNSTGKVNGVPAQDFSLAELEDKPWRKPGADLSDYFNYGFTEDTWIKYCERQKRMRNSESGVGLIGLGINVGKGLSSGNIPVSIVNENSKYGGMRKGTGIPNVKSNEDGIPGNIQPSGGNTIQVMTADRRTYSNKVLGGGGPNYDDMDFGGNPYGADFFSAPPPGYFPPPPPPAGPWGGIPNIPPPGWTPDSLGVPPPMPPPHGNVGGYFDEDSMGPMGSSHSRSSKDERDRDRDRDRDYEKVRESRERVIESRERESRHHSSRRRSRSRSKSRHHKRSRTRSRSRSPSHRHKRKKSKRERED
ncbi:UNVERIFIED_CONTAM: hypothetical protein RMT77_014217 [Armadillidium vulgare]